MERARKFETLDAMRGVAALGVVAYHSAAIMGHELAPSGYLAVDLFFVLSGYVLAHAYDGRDLGLWPFMRLRLIRLWPLYLLGLALAAAMAAGAVALGRAGFSGGNLAITGLLNAFYIPSSGGGPSPTALFPLNGSAWSLFFELVINVAFCTAIFRSKGRVMGLALCAGMALVALAIANGNLSGGWQWSDAYVGLARVAWSFSVGVLLRRHVKSPVLRPVAGGGLMLALAALLLADPGPLRPAFDLAFVLVLSPLLVWTGSGALTPARLRRPYLVVGAASYGIYALHRPVLQVLTLVSERLGLPTWALDLSGACAVLVLAVALDAWFDRPVRRWLTNRGWPARRWFRSPAPRTAG